MCGPADGVTQIRPRNAARRYNPDLALGEAGLVPVAVINSGTHNLTPFHMSLAALRLRANNVSSGEILFDEIRIGRSFADVVPAPCR